MTLEMLSSCISKLSLESDAYTAIIIKVLKRIAVHLCSNFHDLLIVSELCWKQQCCEIRFATVTHISKQFQIGLIPGLGFLIGKDDKRVQRPLAIDVH